MIHSLPLVTPRDSHNLWYTPTSTFSFEPQSQLPYASNTTGSQANSQNTPQGQNPSRARNHGISPLAQLELDEQSVKLRKLNIQRFGATWIKPPGMAKTYQGELDEKAEREEAEAQEAMEDVEMPGEGFDVDEDGQAIHAARDLDANIPEGGELSDLDNTVPEADSFVDGLEDDEEQEEVDLDAEIPEGEAETLWNDSDEEEEEGDEEGDYDDEDDEEETEYASAHQETPVSSTRGGSIGALEESPQQAAFSHDERLTDARQNSRQEYDWRGRAHYRRDPHNNMEVDSDD